MDKQQALKIVEGLRSARAAGAPIVELEGEDARNFNWLAVQVRKELLGSFCVECGRKFFVVVASTVRSTEDFQLIVYEKVKGSPILSTRLAHTNGVEWTYLPTKQDAHNEARKRAFFEAAKTDSIVIPWPTDDITAFSAAINRALDLRHLADAEGGVDDEDEAWQPPKAVLPPRSKLPPSRLGNETVPGVVWQLCTNDPGATLVQIQEGIDALGREGEHPATGVLARYATHYGCTIEVHGEGAQARYTLVTPSTPAVTSEDGVGKSGGLDFEDVLEQLRSESLSFSAELVASYLLALQAKRFVLLTGISGTGKTRLAQEIAKMFGPHVEASSGASKSDAIEIVAKPYQLKYSRFIVPSELAQEFDALTKPEIKRVDLKVPGIPMSSMALYKRPDGGNLFYVTLSGEVKEWFQATIKLGGRFLLAKKTAGEKEWLELTLPTELRPPQLAATYELIAVRPDWTDAHALLGFYNPLTKSYLATPTLRLLLRAHAEVQAATAGPPRPYFLIFDEMNLARVEHYFSDFLSVMESGEPIHLHDDPQVEEEEDIPRRLTIPKNVFVIGTVNVDETTYMFSPKVLDRAFVLEFNDVDLGGLAGPIQSEDSTSTPLALLNLEGGLELRGQGSSEEWKRFETFLGGEARALFGEIHDALAIENRHFGYRVAREVARFVDLAVDQAGTSDATVRAALDIAVLAKILPKLHGSQAEIEATLKRLLSIATGGIPDGDVFTQHGALIDGAALPLPRTARKLGRMLYRLRANGFVSFIE
jgi:hypothetical protein